MNEDIEDVSEYLEDRDADLYDSWREDCCIEFDTDLNNLINEYLLKKNHYMNDKKHLVSSLKEKISSLKEVD